MNPHRSSVPLAAAACLALLLALPSGQAADARLVLRPDDRVVFVGGAASIAADQAGRVETILTLARPGLRPRFRTVAWEGDAIDDHPREPNFPALTNLLVRAQATVVALQFGALEAFDGPARVPAFRTGYERQLADLARALPQTRVVLVTPPPFETKAPPLPDLTRTNDTLVRLVDVIRELATAHELPVVDLFRELQSPPPAGATWTVDGRELTAAGHGHVAAAWAEACGRPDLAAKARDEAFWARPDIAALREAIGTKNRLWFDYWRPMNWAFLNGDRTEQPSSRDHRNPAIRWFPAEMEQFPPLIAEAEVRIESLAAQTRLDP